MALSILLFNFNRKDAHWLLNAIRERFASCDLELSEEKTRLLSFGRKAWADWRNKWIKPETFDFLGFTHFVGTSLKGKYIVGRTTSRKKFRKSLLSLKKWLGEMRNVPMREWWGMLVAKMRGYYQYYGVSGNYRAIERYAHRVRELVYHVLSRRSQRKLGLWTKLSRYLNCFPLPKPRIVHKWYA